MAVVGIETQRKGDILNQLVGTECNKTSLYYSPEILPSEQSAIYLQRTIASYQWVVNPGIC